MAENLARNPLPRLNLVQIVGLLGLPQELVMEHPARRTTFLNLPSMAGNLAHNRLPLLNLVQIVKLPALLLEPVMGHLALQLTSRLQPSTVVKIA
jgi:hypothetical protein